MNMVDRDIDEYLAGLSAHQDAVLLEMEALAARDGFPIVGPQVGRLLEVIARANGARRALELGSGFGYSAIWLARAVGPEGQVVLIEGSAERAADAERFLERAGLGDRIRVEVGSALEIAGGLDETFDLVLNDIDKEDYPAVLDVARARLKVGGLLICDNMLWHGKVLAPEVGDRATEGVLELTGALLEAKDFATSFLPLRDGVSLSYRLA